MSLLSWSDVFSSLGDLDDTDVIIVTLWSKKITVSKKKNSKTYSEKLLSSWNNMSNDKCSSKWVDNMFVIWVQDESTSDFAYSLKWKLLDLCRRRCHFGPTYLKIRWRPKVQVLVPLFVYLFVCSFECVSQSI